MTSPLKPRQLEARKRRQIQVTPVSQPCQAQDKTLGSHGTASPQLLGLALYTDLRLLDMTLQSDPHLGS
jgi:hypothetical protein